MVKTGRWLRSFFLSAKKGQGDDEKKQQQQLPTGPPNSKKRWSFRRSAKGHRSTDTKPSPANHDVVHTQSSGSADAADLAPTRTRVKEEEDAAVKIQASYRAYLARKALKALKGLVKLQAQIRGHLVRKQTTSMLRCMQALVAAQTRAQMQRMQFLENASVNSHKQLAQRRFPSPQQRGDPLTEDKIRDVEIDLGDCRNSYPSSRMGREDQILGPRYRNPPMPKKSEELQQLSPAISGVTEMSPRTCSGHFDELSFKTARSSPSHLSAISKLRYIKDYALLLQQQDAVSVSKSCGMCYPNYMANTESSRAKARSQSAPRRRSDARRPPLDHRSTPRGVRMHRSSSGVGLSGNGSVKFDVSDVSIQESECGSTSSFLSNANNWRL